MSILKMASSKPPQILQLTPHGEIIFEGPFNQVVTSYLELRNPSTERVCFKVKTTAPRRYCVRPNSGIVEPDNKLKIAIMLQPIEEDSQVERSKHKFMVQSTIINDESSSLDTVWHNASPDEIMDSKLRCVFLSSGSARGAGETEESASNKEQNPKNKHISKSTSSNAPEAHSTTQQQPATRKLQQTTAGDGQNAAKDVDYANDAYQALEADKDGRSTNEAKKGTSNAAFMYESESSHNLTSSFLQPLSDDYKIVLVSLAMLIIGVILGKYVI